MKTYDILSSSFGKQYPITPFIWELENHGIQKCCVCKIEEEKSIASSPKFEGTNVIDCHILPSGKCWICNKVNLTSLQQRDHFFRVHKSYQMKRGSKHPFYNLSETSISKYRSNFQAFEKLFKKSKQKCDLCLKAFKNERLLQDHIMNEHTFPCLFCDHVLPFELERSEHIRGSHLGCPMCVVTFDDDEALDRHFKEIHVCEVCGRFFQSIDLKKECQHNESTISKASYRKGCFHLMNETINPLSGRVLMSKPHNSVNGLNGLKQTLTIADEIWSK